MPKRLHDKLARAGTRRGLRGRDLKAYIFSVLNRNKKKRKSKKSTARGRRLARP